MKSKYHVGQEVRIKRFSQGGRFLGWQNGVVVEIRDFPNGNQGQVVQLGSGDKIWGYDGTTLFPKQ